MRSKTKNDLLFSILIPAYNVSAYISECIENVLKQSYTYWEVLIVDDGSTDATATLCDYYARRDHRIRVLHQDNIGVAETRNVLLKEARGQYYIFLDPDDFWSSDQMLDRIAESIFEHDADLVVWWLQEYNMENGEIKKNTNYIRKTTFTQNGADFLYAMVSSGLPSWWSWLYAFRCDLWQKSGAAFRRGRKYCEDSEVLFQVIFQAKKVWILDEYFYCYRRFRKDSITHKATLDNITDMLDVAIKNIDYVTNNEKMSKELKQKLIASFSTAFMKCGSRMYDLRQEERVKCYYLLRSRKWMLRYISGCKFAKMRPKVFIIKIFGIRLGFKLLWDLRSIRDKKIHFL